MNPDPISVDDLRKALATLKAQFAIRGYALHELADGSLLACRWTFTKSLADTEAAAIFLRQVGGAA